MEINERQKNRSDLKSYFVKNAIPTQSNFADVIDSLLNQREDGIVKSGGDPLSIEASGDDTSQKKAINFYLDFNDEKPSWVLSLKPRSDPTDPNSGRPGFSISDGDGNSRLFIDRETSRVGIGTIGPAESLDVKERIKASNLTLGVWPAHPNYAFVGTNALDQNAQGNYALLQHAAGDGSSKGMTFLNSPISIRFRIGNGDKMILANNGNVGIGTTQPADTLDVGGALRILSNSNPVRFTSGWSGFPDAANNQAEICNDTVSYKTLMIVGNKSQGDTRRVSVWDRLEVNGNLLVTGNLNCGSLQSLNVLGAFGASIQCADFRMGHSSRRGSTGRALVDSGSTLTVNYGNDWPGGTVIYNYRAASSRAFKKNFSDLSSREAAETLVRLNPIKFDYRDQESLRRNIGFIAEEMPDNLASDDRASISPVELIAVLTKVAKEQQGTIAALKERVGRLESASNRGAGPLRPIGSRSPTRTIDPD